MQRDPEAHPPALHVPLPPSWELVGPSVPGVAGRKRWRRLAWPLTIGVSALAVGTGLWTAGLASPNVSSWLRDPPDRQAEARAQALESDVQKARAEARRLEAKLGEVEAARSAADALFVLREDSLRQERARSQELFAEARNARDQTRAVEDRLTRAEGRLAEREKAVAPGKQNAADSDATIAGLRSDMDSVRRGAAEAVRAQKAAEDVAAQRADLLQQVQGRLLALAADNDQAKKQAAALEARAAEADTQRVAAEARLAERDRAFAIERADLVAQTSSTLASLEGERKASRAAVKAREEAETLVGERGSALEQERARGLLLQTEMERARGEGRALEQRLVQAEAARKASDAAIAERDEALGKEQARSQMLANELSVTRDQIRGLVSGPAGVETVRVASAEEGLGTRDVALLGGEPHPTDMGTTLTRLRVLVDTERKDRAEAARLQLLTEAKVAELGAEIEADRANLASQQKRFTTLQGELAVARKAVEEADLGRRATQDELLRQRELVARQERRIADAVAAEGVSRNQVRVLEARLAVAQSPETGILAPSRPSSLPILATMTPPSSAGRGAESVDAVVQVEPQPAPPAIRAAVETVSIRPSSSPAIAKLLARADLALQQGDVTDARLLFEHAMRAGSADAAFKLAETYDPDLLKSRSSYGVVGDPAVALRLYRRALEGGVGAAAERIRAIR